MTVLAQSPTLPAPTARRGYSTAWWGMAVLIATEGMIFAILLASYFFLAAASKHWPPAGTELPDLKLTVPFSFVLWGSSLPIFWAEAAVRRGRMGALKAGLALTFVMAGAFLAYTVKDFRDLHFGWQDSAYGSIFYTVVGLHALHVVVGMLINAVVQIKAWQGKFSAGRHVTVEVYALYWHFVDVVWLFVFPSLFLFPTWPTVAADPATVARSRAAALDAAGPVVRGLTVWFAVVGGIGAWTIHLLFLVSFTRFTCNVHGWVWAMHLATVVFATVTLAALALAHRLYRLGRVDGEADDTPAGRDHYLGLLGLVVGSASLALILLEGLYAFVVHRCA